MGVFWKRGWSGADACLFRGERSEEREYVALVSVEAVTGDVTGAIVTDGEALLVEDVEALLCEDVEALLGEDVGGRGGNSSGLGE